MTTLALPRFDDWFEDEDPRDLRRWAIAAAIVFAIHTGAISGWSMVSSEGARSTASGEFASPISSG